MDHDDSLTLQAQLARLELIKSQSLTTTNHPTIPSQTDMSHALSSLSSASSSSLSSQPEPTIISHIISNLLPGFSGQALNPRYYGFVTGGVLPIAQWADNLVSRMDQNVQVHLPNHSIATAVEAKALDLLARLLRLGPPLYEHQENPATTPTGEKVRSGGGGGTFTTGATGSNILGLACGRQAILHARGASVAELGLLDACAQAGVSKIQVLTSAGHSSLSKAASVVGLGHRAVKQLGRSAREPWLLDLDAVEEHLKIAGTASIIVVSAGEVNTGRFGVEGEGEMRRLRRMADEYKAWIHVDGAFGIFVNVLPQTEQYETLHRWTKGLEMADSLTVDGHKILNVPYDCGMFFTRSIDTLQSVCLNPNAAYLSSSSNSTATIPSPLNIGLENSRRFRALPVYAALLDQGASGYQNLVGNMVTLARKLANWLLASEEYVLLPDARIEHVFMIVLFRSSRPGGDEELVERINSTGQMFVSGTVWGGEKAVRMAVSSWKVDVERDFKIATSILMAVARGEKWSMSQVEDEA